MTVAVPQIMESYGNSTPGKDSRGNVFGTYHWANESGHDLHCGGSTLEKRCAPYNFSGRYPVDGQESDFSSDFHVYSVDWTADSITWSVDGEQCEWSPAAQFRDFYELHMHVCRGACPSARPT